MNINFVYVLLVFMLTVLCDSSCRLYLFQTMLIINCLSIPEKHKLILYDSILIGYFFGSITTLK